MLRAKLLAQRHNTPSKAVSRSITPAQNNQRTESSPQAPGPAEQSNHPSKAQPNTAIKEIKEEVKQQPKHDPSNDVNGLEALLDQGKALADAKAAALAVGNHALTKPAATPNGEAEHQQPRPNLLAREKKAAAKELNEHPTRPTNLSHPYYADLPAWLELTGYHDEEFRAQKMSTYKERKALEEEAARIADRLEKLKQAEQEAIQSLRMGTPKLATNMAPPPLPANMPVEKSTPKANGNKRALSPISLPPEKFRRREDPGGFRIRGANDSPTDSRPPPFRRPRTPSPPGLERRITYPDARPDDRRRSIGDRKPSAAKSRDLSLERRQSYYRQDGEPGYYDSYTPREPPRLAYSSTNRNNSISRAPQYRGSVPLDLRKGGQSPFRRA